MKTKFGFLIITVFVVLYASGVSPLYAEKITGRVVDTTNDPVYTATVELLSDSSGTCDAGRRMVSMNIGSTTDVEGNYVILGVQPGTYCLTMRCIGYATKRKPVVVKKDSTARCDFLAVEVPIERNITTPEGIRKLEICQMAWGKGGTWNRELTEWTNTFPRAKSITNRNNRALPQYFQPQNVVRVYIDSVKTTLTATMPLLADEVNPVIVKVSEEGGLVTSLKQENLHGEGKVFNLEFEKQDSIYELVNYWRNVNAVIDTIRSKKPNLILDDKDRFQLPDSTVSFYVSGDNYWKRKVPRPDTMKQSDWEKKLTLTKAGQINQRGTWTIWKNPNSTKYTVFSEYHVDQYSAKDALPALCRKNIHLLEITTQEKYDPAQSVKEIIIRYWHKGTIPELQEIYKDKLYPHEYNHWGDI